MDAWVPGDNCRQNVHLKLGLLRTAMKQITPLLFTKWMVKLNTSENGNLVTEELRIKKKIEEEIKQWEAKLSCLGINSCEINPDNVS